MAKLCGFVLGSILVLQTIQTIRALFPSRAEWEYRIHLFRDETDWTPRVGEVDRLGNAGWEIVHARRVPDESGDVHYECILKRRTNHDESTPLPASD